MATRQTARRRARRLAIASAWWCVVVPCAAAGANAETAPETPLHTLPYTPGLDVTAMDRSVNACNDLYQFACGGWQVLNPIPPDQAAWNVYGKLQVATQRYLWGLLEGSARPSADRNEAQRQIGDYFAACMDIDAVEAAGVSPLQGDLVRIDTLPDKGAIASLLGDLHKRTSTAGLMFAAAVAQDATDSNRMIADLAAGGIGLPDRDYYVNDDPRSVEIRIRYQTHVARMFELAGDAPEVATERAAVVLRIETGLARASLNSVERRNPDNLFHSETLASLTMISPSFDWSKYFIVLGFKPEPWLNVSEPAFLRQLSNTLEHESLDDLKTYLRWGLIDASAPYLSSALVEEDYSFSRAYLLGTREDRPRWRKCVAWVDRDLGDALGKEFVARVFPEKNKKNAQSMTRQIEGAMSTRIAALDWMTPQTKSAAFEKLAMTRNKIGYPDAWRSYTGLTIDRADLFGNVARSAVFETQRLAAKIGKPVDRTEWSVSAPTVNAFYDLQMNDMYFPAGVLMPPLYDVLMDDAPTYGNTGGTIGHELTHAFDDEGRRFDARGNLRDWWTKADADAFESRAQCVRDQYADYVVVDDIKLNSALTAGEDIADLGGELLAWDAWKEQTKGQTLEERDGLTAEQRFFVGMAQWACENNRDEWLRMSAIVEPHSPPRHRVNGVVSNMPAFVQAFHCEPQHKLFKAPERICRLW